MRVVRFDVCVRFDANDYPILVIDNATMSYRVHYALLATL